MSSLLRCSPLLLTAAIASAQQSPAPTFRATTELVQINVVAQDKHGKPVADLRREEFQVLDNGVPQEVRLFLLEADRPSSTEPSVSAPNTFTNRIVAPSGSHSGYSVILIDDLLSGSDPTFEEGSAYARVRTLKMLRSIPVGERIAIYALGPGKVKIICEFTSDRDLLERQLRKWKPTATTPKPEPRPMLLPNPQLAPTRGNADADFERIDTQIRSDAVDSDLGLIADHLAGIPGRKNLIWLANKFVTGRGIQKLNRAGVSIYPVDVDGVCRLCPDRPKQLMEGIARLTGGVAYYSRNDIDVAVREAMDDGRVSYTLGFYPSNGDEVSPPPHRLTVKVGRPGIELRYGTNYQPQAPPSALASADLVQALNRPIDATAIPVTASVSRTQDLLDVAASLKVESLDLVPEHDVRTGVIEFVARFTTADGVFASDPLAQTLTLNLNPTTYDTALRGGFVYRSEFKIPANAVELKLLFSNRASGKIGTLSIRLSDVQGGAPSAK